VNFGRRYLLLVHVQLILPGFIELCNSFAVDPPFKNNTEFFVVGVGTMDNGQVAPFTKAYAVI
jgi:hypothetical protein